MRLIESFDEKISRLNMTGGRDVAHSVIVRSHFFMNKVIIEFNMMSANMIGIFVDLPSKLILSCQFPP